MLKTAVNYVSCSKGAGIPRIEPGALEMGNQLLEPLVLESGTPLPLQATCSIYEYDDRGGLGCKDPNHALTFVPTPSLAAAVMGVFDHLFPHQV